jgi:hypothetical protein
VIVATRSATDSSIEAYGIRGSGRRRVGSSAVAVEADFQM